MWHLPGASKANSAKAGGKEIYRLVSCLASSLTVKIEATCSSETSVFFQRTTWRSTLLNRLYSTRLTRNVWFEQRCQKLLLLSNGVLDTSLKYMFSGEFIHWNVHLTQSMRIRLYIHKVIPLTFQTSNKHLTPLYRCQRQDNLQQRGRNSYNHPLKQISLQNKTH
jgi:hypothetical protein